MGGISPGSVCQHEIIWSKYCFHMCGRLNLEHDILLFQFVSKYMWLHRVIGVIFIVPTSMWILLDCVAYGIRSHDNSWGMQLPLFFVTVAWSWRLLIGCSCIEYSWLSRSMTYSIELCLHYIPPLHRYHSNNVWCWILH